MSSYTPEAGTVTMFSTEWCGYCVRLKAQLDREGIAYREVNIELAENTGAAEEAAALNGGDWIVPTVVFPDGSAATNPSLAEVRKRLG